MTQKQSTTARKFAARTNRTSQRDHSSGIHWLIGAWRLPVPLVWTLWIFGITMPVSTGALGEDVPGASEPAWKRGISRWNGSGYDMPPPIIAPSPASSSSQTPYTMPVDPNALRSSGPARGLDTESGVPFGDLTDLTSIELSGPDVGKLPADNSDAPLTDLDEGSVEELPPPRTDQNADSRGADSKGAGTADNSLPIGKSLDAGQSAASAGPLEEEVVRWYQYPQRWMRGWDSHAELGLDGSNGNADTLAIQTGLKLKRKADAYTLAIDVNYRQASTSDVVTEDNGRLNIDYDRIFRDSPWGGFGKFGLEWDRFKAFNLRVNLNGGVGYHWIRDDTTTLVTRFGAGANQEIGAPDDDWVAEAVFGIEAERQLTARQKLIGKVDYFPAWEDFSNYRLVSDFAWEILLDGSENLSLKLALTDRYDSTPQGAEPNDVYYSLLLLYKF